MIAQNLPHDDCKTARLINITAGHDSLSLSNAHTHARTHTSKEIILVFFSRSGVFSCLLPCIAIHIFKDSVI
jgi:hypothetical protein